MNSYKAHMKKETRQTGFTLVELLITMAVLIITLAIGVPMYDRVIENNRMAADVNNFMTALQYARNVAIQRGTDVTVCSRNSATAVMPTACGSTYANGWFAFIDDITPSSATATITKTTGVFDSGDEILKLWPAMQNAGEVTLSGAGYVSFDHQGIKQGGSTSVFKLVRADAQKNKCIYINGAGLLRTEPCT